MRSAQLTTSPSGVAGAGRDHEWLRMPSSVSSHRFSSASETSAPHTAWSKPPGRKIPNASSLMWPPGPCPQSWPRAMASVSATFSRHARAMPVATCATSRAWLRRVRWWSAGKMKTWVLPASRRKAAECRMRSRSRSKQVRHGSGSSGTARRPPAEARVAPGARSRSSAASRSRRPSASTWPPVPSPAPESAWAVRRPSASCPAMVAAHRRPRSAGQHRGRLHGP